MAPLFLFLVLLAYHSVNPCLCSPPKAVILPMKTQTQYSSQIPKRSSTQKVNFSHNVSLTVTLTVGSPPQSVTMVLDTGSELSWLHCKKSQIFETTFCPTCSQSYSPVPCSSRTCTTRTQDFINPVSCDPRKLCHAVVSYADSTSLEGNLATDTFRMAGTPMPGTVFGCMDTGVSTNVGEDSKTTGLLGLNRGSLSFVSQTGFRKFSYCISGLDSSGVLLLGEASFPWLSQLKYTPLVNMSTPLPYYDRMAYTLHLEGIKVSETPLRVPKSLLEPDHSGAGQTMMDSGTQFTFLLGPVYAALKAEFSKQTAKILKPLGEPNFVFQGGMDLCYRVPTGSRSLPALPAVTLVFRGAEMVVSGGERLLHRVPGEVRGSDSVYCFTFGNSELVGIEAFLVGNLHQQDVWMEYDLAGSRLGLANFRCAAASQRLEVAN